VFSFPKYLDVRILIPETGFLLRGVNFLGTPLSIPKIHKSIKIVTDEEKTMTALKSLYDRDILLWVEDTVAKLKSGDFEHLDINNLIEEVESLGISQRNELSSRLLVLLEHLLKRLYVSLPDDYRGWERTIRNQRNSLEILLKQAPSLRTRWNDSFGDAWKTALKTVRKEYRQVTFPDQWQFPSDMQTMLDCDFWEDSES